LTRSGNISVPIQNTGLKTNYIINNQDIIIIIRTHHGRDTPWHDPTEHISPGIRISLVIIRY
jgi:hypothetical protein